MKGYLPITKGKEPGRPDLESRASNGSPFSHIQGAPSDASSAAATNPTSPMEALFGRTGR
jgi:hypothetical protein